MSHLPSLVLQEVLLTALSDVVQTCSSAIATSGTNVDDIIKCCLREANKEAIKYKVTSLPSHHFKNITFKNETVLQFLH